MRPDGIPTLCRRIPELKLGSYVSFPTSLLALMVSYLMNNEILNEIIVLTPQRGGRRKARPTTKGVLPDKIIRAMGRRMPISVAEGKLRPHEPVQAAKFASETVVIVRSQDPVLTHLKSYNEQPEHFEGFVGRLVVLHSNLFIWPLCNSDFNSNHQGRLAINTNHKATIDACVSVFKSSIRQNRYRLKQEYFAGVPTNEIPRTLLYPT